MLITGASGGIGRAIQARHPYAIGIDLPQGDLRYAQLSLPRNIETVVHLAGSLAEDIDTASDNLIISMNVLKACRDSSVKRLIWASSVRAQEELIGFDVSYYGRAKAAQESMLSAWCAEDPRRIGVALRFGHFCPGSKPPILHEALRLDEEMLNFWINAALGLEKPGFTVLSAIGQAAKTA